MQKNNNINSKYNNTKGYVRENNISNFEDILSKYLKDSEEKIQSLKKNQVSKQRGYGKRNFG